MMSAKEENAIREDQEKLSLAIVGGGEDCLSLCKMLEHPGLFDLNVRITGVADENPNAVGLAHAREKGLFATGDFRELFNLPGLKLIINFSGNTGICETLQREAPEGVSILPHPAARLFLDSVRNLYDASNRLDEQAGEASRAGAFARAMDQADIMGVMVLDTEHRIAWINNAGLKAAGLARGEAISKYCYQVSHRRVSPCALPDGPCPMRETLETGLAAHAIHEHQDASGQSTYCDISTFPLFDAHGRVVEVMEVIRDLTYDLNEKLERRTRDLKNDLAHMVQEDKMISLGRMVASVAHEINNPIASILNFTKLIKKCLKNGETGPKDLEEYDRYLDLTIREAERCGNIVTDLLSFSRSRPVTPKAVDFREIVDQVMRLTRHEMELANVLPEVDVGDMELTVWGDFSQLQQCLLNLVFNAVEAMPGGGRLIIRGGTDQKSGLVRIEVSDSGTGIEPEHIDQIFEPFFTTKEEGKGVGLGLSMVYGIIHEHGGAVSAHSNEDQGASFLIELPMAAGKM